ncbi:MAG: YgdI/YgdR family lipoprotein [Cetobacterium sp.]|nr:YgdI/YgdR family lipoprotein [Cetobacterium sp.]
MKKMFLFILMFATLLLSACSSMMTTENGSVPLDPNSHTVNNFVEGTQAEE